MAQEQDDSQMVTISAPTQRRSRLQVKGSKKRVQQNAQIHKISSVSEENGNMDDETYPKKVEEAVPRQLGDILKSWLPVGPNAFLFSAAILAGLVLAIINFTETHDITLLYIILVLVAHKVGIKVIDVLPAIAKIAEIVRTIRSKEKDY